MRLCYPKLLGREIGLGKIIRGDDRATLTVKPGALASEVGRVTEKIDTLLSSNSPPELILNRHCPPVRVSNTSVGKKRLRETMISLLSGITETERNSHRSKGDSPLSSFPTRSDPAARAREQRICNAALLCVAGARHPREHCLYSRDPKFS